MCRDNVSNAGRQGRGRTRTGAAALAAAAAAATASDVQELSAEIPEASLPELTEARRSLREELEDMPMTVHRRPVVEGVCTPNGCRGCGAKLDRLLAYFGLSTENGYVVTECTGERIESAAAGTVNTCPYSGGECPYG